MKIGIIRYYTEEVNFKFRHKRKVTSWITHCIQAEGRSLHSLNIVFCDDAFLLKLNKTYLNHDTFTDIITFDLGEDTKQIQGEIYISVDRVNENATLYSQSFHNELHRVIIHGVLHLLGYQDKTKADREMIRSKEDFYLSLLPEIDK